MTAATAEHGKSEGLSLSKIFNFVVKGALLYVGMGVLDLALWHYDPGGVALFETVREPILNAFEHLGITDALNTVATWFGGGSEQMAVAMGGAEVDLGGGMDAFIPDY